MTVTLQKGLNQSKLTVFILEIDRALSCFSRSSSQVSDNTMSTKAHQVGRNAQDPSGKIMTP
jgi:lipid-binding SYLF domain-containing protein